MDPQETLPLDPEALIGLWEFLMAEGALLWRQAMRPWTSYQIGIIVTAKMINVGRMFGRISENKMWPVPAPRIIAAST